MAKRVRTPEQVKKQKEKELRKQIIDDANDSMNQVHRKLQSGKIARNMLVTLEHNTVNANVRKAQRDNFAKRKVKVVRPSWKDNPSYQ